VLDILKPHQNHSRKCPPAGFLYGLRPVSLGPDFSADNPAQVAVIYPKRLGDIGLGQAHGLEAFLKDAHEGQFVVKSQTAQGQTSTKVARPAQNGGMNSWLYRDAFDAEYQAYIKRTKMTAPQVAEILGVSVDSLNGYRRPKNPTEPKPETLVKAAQLFGCDVYRFMTNWGLVAASGVDPTKLDDLTVHRIAEGAKALNDPKLSQEELDLILRALKNQ